MSPATTNIDTLDVSVYAVPTDAPEADGTATWDHTTMVLVEVRSGSAVGIGYTYGDPATAVLIRDTLAPLISGRDALSVAGAWQAMVDACRNLGRPGIASMAIAAIDNALWDLKARILDLPLATLLDSVRDAVPIYGSGGFTSYTDEQLAQQMASFIEAGIPRAKMKVGREPDRDPVRVAVARSAIGPDAELYVDANGALDRQQALRFAHQVSGASNVTWFEEPVSSDDLDGLRFIRDRGPCGMDIAAGEYGYTQHYFQHLLAARAVDCVQIDVTRCGGITAFMRIAAMCDAWSLPVSAHCAPAMHLHPCCAVPRLRHLEYFHDHVRIERIFFDGVPDPRDGALHIDQQRPGNGLVFKRADARRFAA